MLQTAQKLLADVLRWHNTVNLPRQRRPFLEQKRHQDGSVSSQHCFDLQDHAIFLETTIVPVIPVPAMVIATPSGHHGSVA